MPHIEITTTNYYILGWTGNHCHRISSSVSNLSDTAAFILVNTSWASFKVRFGPRTTWSCAESARLRAHDIRSGC